MCVFRLPLRPNSFLAHSSLFTDHSEFTQDQRDEASLYTNTFLFIQRRGRMYNADLQVHTIRHAMLEQLRNPPAGQVTCCTQWLSTHLVATLFRITSMCTRYKHSLTCLWIKSLR